MYVHCDKCDLIYDDTYHLTYCPHPKFDMHTVASNREGKLRCCHSIEELEEFMMDKKRDVV